jgi:plastocyanin
MRIFLAAIVVTSALVGCGGEEPATAPMAAASPAPTKAEAARVTIKDFEYAPRNLKVAAGTKVTWIDEDAANHTVSFARGPGELGNVSEGKTVSARFTKPGRYAYVCQYHPGMKGTVTVR